MTWHVGCSYSIVPKWSIHTLLRRAFVLTIVQLHCTRTMWCDRTSLMPNCTSAPIQHSRPHWLALPAGHADSYQCRRSCGLPARYRILHSCCSLQPILWSPLLDQSCSSQGSNASVPVCTSMAMGFWWRRKLQMQQTPDNSRQKGVFGVLSFQSCILCRSHACICGSICSLS